jgi:hypothetical protein
MPALYGQIRGLGQCRNAEPAGGATAYFFLV